MTREIPGSAPGADDVLVLAKRRMSDLEPYFVATVASAQTCADLRASFIQPSGNANPRPIAPNVQKNIAAYCPRCAAQGAISRDGEAYLSNWAEEKWTRIPRPGSYSCLAFRRPAEEFLGDNLTGVPRPWQAPRRGRVIDVTPGTDVETSGEESSDNVQTDLRRPALFLCLLSSNLLRKVGVWAAQLLSRNPILGAGIADGLRSAGEQVKVASICSGWGVGEIGVAAITDALRATLPEEELKGMAQAE